MNIVSALKDDFEFYILTSAYDLGDFEPYNNVTINEWYDQEGVFLKYMDRQILNNTTIRQNILEINPDMLYLNSLFSKRFTLLPLLIAKSSGYPVVLAPRGMLGDGALEIKRGKKSTFLFFAKLLRLYSRITWHASTTEEEKEIRRRFGKKSRIKIAQNIAISQKFKLEEVLNSKKTGSMRFIFVSRIAIKKNLHLAIQALKQVTSKVPIEFHIYGNIEEPQYWEMIEGELTQTEGLIIEYKGVVPPAELPEIFMNANFLILPTKHENYGHAIVEAWSNGCPVIISKNTPWKNLNDQNLGWDVDLKNFDNLVTALQEAVDLDFTSYISQVTSSFNYFKDVITDNEIIEANRKLFADGN